jgi:internalin A
MSVTFVDLGDLCKCSSLSVLCLFECQQISSLAALSGCSQLTYLVMSDIDRVSDLTPLQALPLRSLTLGDFRNNILTPDISPLSSLVQLTELRLVGHSVSRLPVVTLTQLQVLDIDRCKSLADLNPLRACRQLKDLSMRGCTAVSSLTPLGGLPCLERLRLSDCTAVTDLRPLSSCAALQNLGIRGSGVTCLAPLGVLTNLVLFGCGDDLDQTPLNGLDIELNSGLEGPPYRYESNDEDDDDRCGFELGYESLRT